MIKGGQKYAIKVLNSKFIKKNNLQAAVQNEINVLTNLDHGNIIKLHDSFEDKNVRVD